jgi:cell division protease FtsH
MKKKNPKKLRRFQPKIFAIWGVLIASLLIAWTIVSPDVPSQNVEWSVNDVAEAIGEGRVISGEMRPIPGRGPQWYRIRGKAYASDMSSPVDFTAQGRLTDERFSNVVATNVLREKPCSTFFSDLAISVLPFFIVIVLIWLLLARQMRGAGKNAMSFGKSRAKLYGDGTKKVTFSDVAGCDEAKEEVAEIVDFLKEPKKYNEIGGRIPKGCLMIGPPGTGKTLLAKAIAGEADVPFFFISGSDFVEMFVGVGAARVRDLFEQGKKHAPCIVFIDEIDAVGRQRGAGLGGGNDEREQTLNSILVEMDGFDGRDGVIIMAATNRPDVLDNALLRPGRFDRQIVIDLPDIRGREEILQVHAKKIKLTDDVNLSELARNTSGFSGADLENFLNEGALLAARRGKKKVDHGDLEEAREKVAYGRERKRVIPDSDKKVTAYHEAGHAIVQAAIDDGLLPVHKVTIIPRGRSLGSTMFMPSKDILNYSKKHILNEICCAMGGRVAEELIFEEMSSGAAGDIKSATQLARRMICDWGMSTLGPISYGENADHIFLGREITRTQNYSESTARRIDDELAKVITQEYDRAKKILVDNRKILDSIAEGLLEHETLEGKVIYATLKRGDGKLAFVVDEAESTDACADGNADSTSSTEGCKKRKCCDKQDKSRQQK